MTQNVRRDPDEITVEFGPVPVGKDFAHFVTRHPEAVAHQLVGLADELHVAVLDAVVHHLDKVPGAVLPDPVAAGGTVFHFGADGLEDGFYMFPCGRRTARHHRGAFESAFLAAGYAAADIKQAFAFQSCRAAHGIRIVAVAAVDENVALFQQRKELLNERIHRGAGLDHHEDLPGL